MTVNQYWKSGVADLMCMGCVSTDPVLGCDLYCWLCIMPWWLWQPQVLPMAAVWIWNHTDDTLFSLLYDDIYKKREWNQQESAVVSTVYIFFSCTYVPSACILKRNHESLRLSLICNVNCIAFNVSYFEYVIWKF
jgi:hypothetical protein